MDVNKTTLIGRLTSDPQRQKARVKLSFAVRYQWNESDATRRRGSQRIIVYATDKLADICTQYLHAQSRVYCEAHFDKGRFIADEIIILSPARR